MRPSCPQPAFSGFLRFHLIPAAAICALVCLAWAGRADSPPSPGIPVQGFPALSALTVEPTEILLSGANRQQQILATARTADGKLIDVTHTCKSSSAAPGIASVVDGVIYGNRDGATILTIRVGELSARIPIRVRDFAGYPPVHFGNDVAPLFSKLGCNSGGCHGKASGQNGFKLSVFGFDPQADYDALVKESRGRRVFPAAPEQSLVLRKPTGQSPHGGGKRIELGSPDYQLLKAWIEQGMPTGRTDAPHVVGLRVSPTERILGFHANQQILATALYSDGTSRDVTGAAGYSSNAGHIAEVERGGHIHTGQAPGEAAVTINYVGQIAVVRICVPRPGSAPSYPVAPIHNKVDGFIWAKLKTMAIVPSDLCDDATFLRRTYLDVIGTLPPPDEVRDFLADKDPNKRQKLIDRVLERPEYAAYWALQWSDILLVNRDKLGDRGAFELHRWLHDQFAHNRPYDRWVHELISASGTSAKNGPVNFFRAAQTTEDVTKAVSQAFLGIRLECAQCHHHPFEHWGQEDFYGLAGFFNGIERKPNPGEGEMVVQTGFHEMAIPRTSRIVPTHPPGGAVLDGKLDTDPRRQLADWMTKPGNPWFARLVVNRLWKHYLGHGLVEPEDDLRSTNPATNEPLLAYLADRLVACNYDLKEVTRLILTSRTYQLSSVTNATNADDDQNYSHYRAKRLSAEVLLDAISMVTECPEAFPGRPRGTRAIDLWDNRLPSYFLDAFGRSERVSPCECGRSSEPTMAQCLHLMNAPEIERKIAGSSGRIARLVRKRASEGAIVEELCLAALGRQPGAKEKQAARKLFDQEPSDQAAQDLLWALLNSYEFLFVQ
ncbi:MAG TPA: DUF1549 domain-containing protein [Gemmataceae bacterium]|nr:DUF1549 domain-containing protein [Gemmataceae bacterium]